MVPQLGGREVGGGGEVLRVQVYLTIIPRARMDYWLRDHEGERNNYCFSKIQLVGQKYRSTKQLKARL